MAKVKFGDVVKDVKINVDRTNNPYERYIAGDHMDSEDLTLRRWGHFATDDVGPAFIRIFKPGQVLYGSRRTYLKKVAVAHFEGITANTTFVLETKDDNIFAQRLLPFLMLSENFTNYSIRKSKGSTNPYVLFSDLADYEFELPSIEEQRVLADKLWAAYELKEAYKKMIAATDEMVKSQFIEMFGDINDNSNGIPFDEIFYDDTKSATKISASEYLSSGQYAIYDQSQDTQICGYSNDDDGVNMDYPVILFGDHSRVVKLIDRPFYIGADGVKIIRSKQFDLNVVFAYYMIKYCNIPETGYNRHFKYLKLKRFFAPDREKQNQFVAIAQQADKSKFELRQAIEKIDKVMKSLIN